MDALFNNIGAEVITVKITDTNVTPEKIANCPLTVTGSDDDGTIIMERCSTEGAGFEAIGLYAGDAPDTYAVAIGGWVWIQANGSIENIGYQLIGYDSGLDMKSVSEGGRAVTVWYSGGGKALIKF